MRQLVPGLGEGRRKLLGVLVEPTRNLQVGGVLLERNVGGEHDGGNPLALHMGVGHCVGGSAILGRPLVGTGRTLGQLPLVLEQVVKVAVVPLGRVVRPRTLEAARNGILANAGAVLAQPAKALRLDWRSLWLGSDEVGVARAVRLAKGVPAGNESHRLLIVHGHATERLTNVTGGSKWVRLTVGSLGVDVDESHLHGSQRVLQLPIARVPLVVQPRRFRAPVHVRLGLPRIFSTASEAVRLKSHIFEGHVAHEYHEVSPREGPTILCLDRPQQPPSLVQVRVVGPAVERSKTLLAGASATSAV
mmetsp:Transcript_16306/g.51029  ORF Transcript_16306/g.51029 Transcript_16306/m.51029 type:complete len:304 (+) Transcript_16306:1044-1955(+)